MSNVGMLVHEHTASCAACRLPPLFVLLLLYIPLSRLSQLPSPPPCDCSFPLLFGKSLLSAMSSTGAGYDQTTIVFSPDGRMYQTEYAAKAVENAGTSVGVQCKDGVILATEKMMMSKMLCSSSNRRIFTVDLGTGIAASGFAPDGRQLMKQARGVCVNYRKQYGIACPPDQLADRLAQIIHVHTMWYYLRPFGAACVIAGYNEDKAKTELWTIASNGVKHRVFGGAIGKGSRAALTEIERGKFLDMTCEEALNKVAKIVATVHDDVKDKPYVLEMSWICEATGWKHRMVPEDRAKAARDAAEAELRAEDEESDDDDDDDDDDEEEE